MTNLLKRMLSLVMAIMMALSVVPVTAVAEGMILPVPVAIVQDPLPETMPAEETGEESAQTEDDPAEAPAEEAISEEIALLADSDVIAEGTCGGTLYEDDVFWTITADGTLTLSGNGTVADFGSAYYQPWKDYRSDIERVVIC